MPQNEKWGQEGWSYRDEEDAWAKFRGLVESRKGSPYAYPEPRNGFEAGGISQDPCLTIARYHE